MSVELAVQIAITQSFTHIIRTFNFGAETERFLGIWPWKVLKSGCL